jgi:hypothetical protein
VIEQPVIEQPVIEQPVIVGHGCRSEARLSVRPGSLSSSA